VRTTAPVGLVLAIVVASLMWGGSGYGAGVANDPTAGLGPMEQDLEDRANGSNVNRDVEGEGSGFEGSAGGGDESNLVSFIINGGQAVMSVATFVLFLPVGLESLGAPYWFAWPMGLVTQLVASIGIIQFVTGRIYQ